ncbi:MAG: AAA family ATPase [Spirochaetes bacterium]|jgi:type II secretory pathway predicted ATPase ExeA|nr:AAA family ATPase [Spirochaetota bacterium]
MIALSNAFGLSSEPFAQDVPTDKLFALPGLSAFLDRFDYAVRIGAATLITGEVGSGKSTSLRAAASRLHPSQYVVIALVASSGSVLDFLRSLCLELGSPEISSSTAKLTRMIREAFATITAKKQQPLLIIDEAHLLRLELLAQLHALTQLPFDRQAMVPMVLSGQNILVDRLLFHTSRPFASRVIGRTLLEGLRREQMADYLSHHLSIVGGKPELLTDEAVTAIHQSSGGLLRRANALARGAMLAAAGSGQSVVTAEHVRLAATEIL